MSVDDRGATCTTGSTVAADAPDRITNVATVQSSTAQVVPSDPSTVTAGDPLRASDPAPVHAAPKPASELAFTGAVGLGLGGLLALAAVMAGLVLLLLRRRRV
ncbi:hypothetical protein [Curtobacterium sp. ZW137]|uniref:hypothetical protein n=1 Tax=Curtobacterium sp. ZW137 TaxID=2485104 RepID=UPI000F4C8CCC|nr:hypothetical protein [Curtobacterium sp. ZW137]ROP63278.1 hypothetical protein EDF55_2032 [Curtobacterium sp. ZW137]